MFIAFLLSMAGAASGEADVQKEPSCRYCGMDRARFAHSRMLVTYDDGTILGTCSLHCMAVDLALKIDNTPRLLQVGDFNSKNLIDAEKAFWVIGGNRPGVMSKQAKWAFEKKEEAERFIMEYSGTLATFDEALKAAYESMSADTNMIRNKRKMMKTKGAGNP